MTEKLAVVLFNLGGPDRPEAVAPFLFNLFNDPAIIRLPGLLRTPLARLIASRRAPKAQAIYAKLGGGSPLLPNTEAQRAALETSLRNNDMDARVFIAMRYWHPRAAATVKAVKDFAPDQVLLLPLYPQFSTTTTASSIAEWHVEAARAGLTAPTQSLCCYPDDSGFLSAMAAAIRPLYTRAAACGKPRLLFSAHGLPEKVVKDGDPYQAQCEATARALAAALDIPNLDWVNCYQSRVGPMRWIGPATEDEITRAGRERVPVILVPIAFVSEHSETLVELDIEYRHLADAAGVPLYLRAPTVGADPDFIAGLAALVRARLAQPKICCSATGERFCATSWRRCPMAA